MPINSDLFQVFSEKPEDNRIKSNYEKLEEYRDSENFSFPSKIELKMILFEMHKKDPNATIEEVLAIKRKDCFMKIAYYGTCQLPFNYISFVLAEEFSEIGYKISQRDGQICVSAF